ncbi:hypothetical protein DL764_005234 [Monosporascus ibericus]|uniref:Major facilitator superfamily (MFS) profile domain-containing protein n=1 Tax=Monosporascus ibericus TaxID=155417 RepID=A0A4Q4TA01_9PEZI|nr:hypothetical protein DL764_005234 [Monosporascus ibericus]
MQNLKSRPGRAHTPHITEVVAQRYDDEEYEASMASWEVPQFERVYWTKEPHLRKLYAWACVLMIASATTGFDAMLVNTSQQIDRWKEYFPMTQEGPDNPQEIADSWLGLMVNLFNIGSISIADGFPLTADRALPPPASWSRNSSVQLLGALLVAWIGWGTAQLTNDWSWRSITLLQILPSVIQIVFIGWIPESPRYLMAKDRPEEALHILAKYHGGGDRNNATVQFEYREIKETMRIEKEVSRFGSYIDFVKTKGNRWRLAILISLGVISQYSGNALFSNYMDAIYIGAGVTDQDKKLALSGGKTILDLIVTVLAALNVDRFGRRPLFLLSISGMVVSFALWTVCGAVYENSGLTNLAAGYAQLVLIWVFGIFYDIGFSGLLIAYALEILPFHLRAKGMMIMNVTLQAVLALSNQTNKLAWNRMPTHWYLMLFYTLWDFVELVFVYFFYVETKGPTLEEIARIFDGADAVAHINLRQVEKEINAAEHEEDINRRSWTKGKNVI